MLPDSSVGPDIALVPCISTTVNSPSLDFSGSFSFGPFLEDLKRDDLRESLLLLAGLSIDPLLDLRFKKVDDVCHTLNNTN